MKRAWEDCEDIDELADICSKQADQIEKLKKENKALKVALQSAEGEAENSADPEQLERLAAKWRKSIHSNILNQMVYKKGSRSSRVSAEVANIDVASAKAILGDDLASKASNGPKQMQVVASSYEAGAVLGSMSKSLRYGAQLQLIDGLKFTYDKSSKILKASGSYMMFK